MSDNLDPESIKELNNSLREMRESINSMVPAIILSTTAMNQQVAASKGLVGSEKDATKVVEKWLASQQTAIQLNEEQAKANARSKEIEQQYNISKQQGKEALKQFTNNLLTVGGGLSKYNDVIDTATTALSALLFVMGGPLFKGLSLLVGLFGEAAKAVNKQNDAMIKSYDDLSEIGATSSLTTRNILELGDKAGFTSHNLETFSKNAKSVGSNLISMGGTMSKGVEAFAGMTKLTQTQRDAYNRLGMSQDRVIELQADYVNKTTAAGLTLSKSPKKLQEESLKYIDSLNELATLTGISVKAQQDAQDQANADENFNAFKFAQGQKRDELNAAADKETDKAKQAELRAQADGIDAMIKAKDETARLAKTIMSASNATAVLQSISTTGAVTYTESNAKLLQAGIDIEKINQKTNKGQSGAIDLLSEQARAAKRFTNQFGEAGYAYGQASKDLQETMGVDNKMRMTAAQFAELQTEEGKKAFTERMLQEQKELEKKKKGEGPKDDAKDQQNATLAAELAARKAADSLTTLVSGPVTGALTMFMNGVTKAADVLTAFVNKVGKWFGIDSTPSAPQQTAANTPAPAPVTTGGGAAMVAPHASRRGGAAATGVDATGRANAATDPRTRSIGAPTSAPVQTSTDQLKDAGLVLKKGDVQKEGAELDPRLIEIAKQIQSQVPGFMQFTGFNDQFHSEKAPSSMHTKGKAFDFTVSKKPTKEEGQQIKDIMTSLGLDYAIDEYNNPSGNATAGHFHGQLNDKPKAYDGGVFEGPIGGFDVELHGREAVVPLPNPDSIITVDSSKPEKEPLASVMNNAATSQPAPMMDNSIMIDLMEMLAGKLDNMISVMETGNDTSEKILQYSQV